MSAFVQDIERFRGTGEKNRQGKTLEEFISVYDAKKYDCPSNTVDMIVLRSDGPYRDAAQPLRVLMVKRGNHPSIGWWALPGGFVNLKEDLDHAARRELEEETGVQGLPMVQLRTWGAWDRDPRWRVITTAYLALVEGDLPVMAGDDAADAAWFDAELKEVYEEAETMSGKTVTRFELKLIPEGQPVAPDAQNTPVEPNAADAQAPPDTTSVPDVPVASFLRIRTRRGPLTDTRYELLSSDGIAVDHGLILADAILYLEDTIRHQE